MNIKPEEILLLSFTKKSASDMKRRVESEIGQNMECYTFHKLGLDIIKKELPGISVYEGNFHKFIEEQIKELIKDEKYLEELINLIVDHNYLGKDEFSFETKSEYNDYLKINPLITIRGEEVKSFGELEIANYLFTNNINYEYEKQYKYITSNEEYIQYKPDFYLPDYDIYIEYFGIDGEGNVPDYFESRHGKSPKKEYNDGIRWKKNIHKINKTKLVDIYYYEKKNGELKTQLEKQLIKNNVILNPMTNNSIFKYVEKSNKGILSNVAASFGTVINLIKSNNYLIDDLRIRSDYDKYRDNIIITLDLIEPILNKYEDYLNENKEIDFNDMINTATSACLSRNYISKYKYVIVDEFQDISNSRYKLLQALRDTQDYKLYCVGDDFQSIYRFSGSDIGIFTNFEKYFGPVQINIIEKTHRFSNRLATISGYFIMKNPNQIKKELKGTYSIDFPLSKIEGYTRKNTLKFFEEKLDYLEKNSSVLFLGRYNFDIDPIKENNNFILSFDRKNEIFKVVYKKRKDLKIEFMTIHKSKGLEADYVVLLNTKKDRMGFPSKIMDLPITRLLLDNSDDFPYSEERRLFYVALTRARKKVYMLVEQENKSMFISELENSYNNEFQEDKYSCPKCGKKIVYIKEKKKWICSNEECNYIKEIKNKNEQLKLFNNQ